MVIHVIYIKLNKPIRPAIVVHYHLLPPIRPRNDQVLYSSTETERFMVGKTHGRTVFHGGYIEPLQEHHRNGSRMAPEWLREFWSLARVTKFDVLQSKLDGPGGFQATTYVRSSQKVQCFDCSHTGNDGSEAFDFSKSPPKCILEGMGVLDLMGNGFKEANWGLNRHEQWRVHHLGHKSHRSI